MSESTNAAPAGWYPDATPGWVRYWDGAAWTAEARPVAVSADDTPGLAASADTAIAGTVVAEPTVAYPVVADTAMPQMASGDAPKQSRKKLIVGGSIAAGVLLIAGIGIGAANAGSKPATSSAPVAVASSAAAEDAAEVSSAVPATTGKTAKEARVLLENAGLEVEFSADEGVVLDQDNWTVVGTTPVAGEALAKGQTVVVNVVKTAKLQAEASPAAPAAPAVPALTLEQQNAVASAKSYLSFTAFSRAGLIEQLSSEYGEGYPVDVATFAVDYVNPDWNAEAAQSAKSYLELQSFSRDGLYEQLTSEYGEGFTPEQANAGLAAVGY